VVELGEGCDDGNTMPFDGCSQDCQLEPNCSSRTGCTSPCGDGIISGSETCDDGNRANGDGCSSTCQVEAGWACAQPALGAKMMVPVIYRDFKFHNPSDFEAGVTGSYNASTGMVNADLDGDGKPVFTGITGGGIHVVSTSTFAEWYRNTAGVDHATPSKLALWNNGSGAYVNRYGPNGEQWINSELAYYCGNVGAEQSDANGNPIPCTSKLASTDCDGMVAAGKVMVPGSCTIVSGSYQAKFVVSMMDGNPLFFPVDSDPFSANELVAAQVFPMYDQAGTYPFDLDAAGKKVMHNFSFTSEMRYWFRYDSASQQKLDFVGDDDLWVFVNKRLAVDLGGIHGPVLGSVTLDATSASRLGLTDGQVYEIAVFSAERQSTGSAYQATLPGFNMASSVCSPL
jgi:fibro-slime domain-containing protein